MCTDRYSNEELARCPVSATVELPDPIYRRTRVCPCVIVRESRCFYLVRSSADSMPGFLSGAERRVRREAVEVCDDRHI